ncbi:MAG TPA: DUF1841 family protein [Steroidobacteraceae bacterium]|nr:DUF1841 family protein [Steroidobacteraceae bacterium]
MSAGDAPPPFGAYSRDQLRQSYAEAWRKHLARSPLTPLEALIADVLELHPEYHSLVQDSHAAMVFEPTSGDAQENPFLHMGLHLAVREQVSIDRPPGVRALLDSLKTRLGDAHEAEHALMESLAETLWEAQRSGRAPDESRYLELARLRLARGG